MKVMVNFQLGKLNVKDEIINNDTSVEQRLGTQIFSLSHARVIVDYFIFHNFLHNLPTDLHCDFYKYVLMI